ncbi:MULTISPECIES: hypothetical protein [Kitasatospora]|nr:MULTISPECIES: hypothetical protein [Kitasatospora]
MFVNGVERTDARHETRRDGDLDLLLLFDSAPPASGPTTPKPA